MSSTASLSLPLRIAYCCYLEMLIDWPSKRGRIHPICLGAAGYIVRSDAGKVAMWVTSCRMVIEKVTPTAVIAASKFCLISRPHSLDCTDELAALNADPTLLHRRYPELDCGQSGGRLLTLRGATFLHIAPEHGSSMHPAPSRPQG